MGSRIKQNRKEHEAEKVDGKQLGQEVLNRNTPAQAKTVFATVGTTKFDEFIDALDTEEVQAALLERGFQRLVIQKG
jgi:hypothetical protein